MSPERKLLIGAGAAGCLLLLSVVVIRIQPGDGISVIEVNQSDAIVPDKYQTRVEKDGLLAIASESEVQSGQSLPPRARLSPKSRAVAAWETPAFQDWMKTVTRMPAEQQLAAVSRKLMELNPGFDGTLTGSDGFGKPTIAGGVITAIGLSTNKVTDLSPMRAFVGLKALGCNGTRPGEGKLADLSPLTGLPLTYLHCHMTQVSDLSPLRGMKLVELVCASTAVSDLSPLEGMPLTLLYCSTTQVSDLSPLRGMPLASLRIARTKVSTLAPLEGLPLTELDCHLQPVSDLSPLRGMQLARLHCADTRVSDLSPLKAMALTELTFTPKNIVKGLDIIRRMKSLQAIGGASKEHLPPAEFWKKYDAGEYGKPGAEPSGTK